MQEDEGYLVFLEGDLDAVAVDGIKGGWKIDGDFMTGHRHVLDTG
jgi:hypothetical protein